MVYSPEAPYELLCNGLIDFPAMQRVRRFAKYWELVANSGNYTQTVAMLWTTMGRNGEVRNRSPFETFMAFTEWAYGILHRTDGINLFTWAELFFRYHTHAPSPHLTLYSARASGYLFA